MSDTGPSGPPAGPFGPPPGPAGQPPAPAYQPPAAGPPPPPTYVPPPASAGNGGRRNRGPLFIIIAIVVIGLIIGGVLVAAGSNKKASAEVFLEPTKSDGIFPWTGSIADPNAPTSVPLPTTVPPAGAPSTTVKATAAVVAVTGDRAGIYGGTLDNKVCDKDKLITFLEQHP